MRKRIVAVDVAQKLDKATINPEIAKSIGERLGIDWGAVEFTPEDFAAGLGVELEHGSAAPETDVTQDDALLTGKITWAHLKERADYYRKLKEMEQSLAKSDPAIV